MNQTGDTTPETPATPANDGSPAQVDAPVSPDPQLEAASANPWAIHDVAQQVADDRPASLFTRIVEGFAWIVGAAGVLFFGRVYAVLMSNQSVTAYEVGAIAGTITAAIIGGVIVRWIWIRACQRGRVRSPWILVVAALLLLFGFGRQASIGSAAQPAQPIGSYLSISPPFSLQAATAEEEDGFSTAIAGRLGPPEIRRVIEDGEVVGWVIVANAGAGGLT